MIGFFNPNDFDFLDCVVLPVCQSQIADYFDLDCPTDFVTFLKVA